MRYALVGSNFAKDRSWIRPKTGENGADTLVCKRLLNEGDGISAKYFGEH